MTKIIWLAMLAWIFDAQGATTVVNDRFEVGFDNREIGGTLVGKAVQSGEGAWANRVTNGSSMSGSLKFVEGGVTESVGGGGGIYVEHHQPDGSIALEVILTPNDFTGNFTIGMVEDVNKTYFININTGDVLKYRYIMAGVNAGRFQWSVFKDGVSAQSTYSSRSGVEAVGANNTIRLTLSYNHATGEATGTAYNLTGGYELSTSTISVPELEEMDQIGFGWSSIPNQSTTPSVNPGVVSGFTILENLDGLSLPLRESFETSGNVSTGQLHGQNKWEVEQGNAIVQISEVNTGTQAVSMDTGIVTRPFSTEKSLLWTRIYARIDDIPEANPAPPDSLTATAFFIDTNLNVVVFDGTNATILPHATITVGAWTQFDVFCNYNTGGETNWSLALNASMVAENLSFFNQQATLSSIKIASGGVPILLDDISLDDTEPVDLDPIDSDSDGLPDWWEQSYFGAAASSAHSEQIGAQGMRLSDTYLAGLDPLNSADRFTITLTKDASQNRRLEWKRREARKYDVFWSSDLRQDFELIAEDWPGDFFTESNTERSSARQGFYRLEVHK